MMTIMNLTENVTMNNIKSRSITININICEEIKTENTTIQYNDDNKLFYHNDDLFNKIKQMSPEHCDIFTENIFEIKTETNHNPNNFENLTNVLTSENEDVNSSNIIQLEFNPYAYYKGNVECCILEATKVFIVITLIITHLMKFSPTFEVTVKLLDIYYQICPKILLLTASLAKKGSRELDEHQQVIALAQWVEELSYICEVCNKVFSRKVTLDKHVEQHSQEISDVDFEDSDEDIYVLPHKKPKPINKKSDQQNSVTDCDDAAIVID